MGASIYVFLPHFCVSLDNFASSLALSAFTAAHIGKGPIQLGQIGLLNLRCCQIHLKMQLNVESYRHLRGKFIFMQPEDVLDAKKLASLCCIALYTLKVPSQS